MMRRERKEKATRKTQRPRATMWKVCVRLLRVYVTVKSAESSSEEG